MVDAIRWRILLVAFSRGGMNRRQLEVIVYLREENRILKEHLGGQRLHFTDPRRRRLAATGHVLGVVPPALSMGLILALILEVLRATLVTLTQGDTYETKEAAPRQSNTAKRTHGSSREFAWARS